MKRTDVKKLNGKLQGHISETVRDKA